MVTDGKGNRRVLANNRLSGGGTMVPQVVVVVVVRWTGMVKRGLHVAD